MRTIISLLFFLSGIAGLIYEVVWAKQLSLFLGNTTQAHTLVLATFMGGLALGYRCFGKMGDRIESSLNLYGWMEMAIGVAGLLFVPLLAWLGAAYVSWAASFGLGSLIAAAFKFLLCVLLILVPTTLMGGTLPVLSRFVVRSISQVESGVAWLYFFNSFGAVLGSLLAGFVLIPRLGLNLSIVVAAILNLSVGLIALSLRPLERGAQGEGMTRDLPSDEARAVYTTMQIRFAIWGIALSGAAALIYEIAWIRLLSLVFGSSTYSFSLMLAAFIAGIASGSFIVSRRWVLRFDPYLLFTLAELAIALSIVFTLPLYERLPFYFAKLANLFVRTPETFWLYQLTQFSVCFLLMLIPTLFLGMTLPLVSQVAAQSLRRLGQNIGNVFAVNTVGTLIGAAAAGLVLLPLVGIKRLIEFGVLINLLVGLSTFCLAPGLALSKKALVSASSFVLFLFYLTLFPAWDEAILSSGTFRMRAFDLGMTYRDFKKGRQEKVRYHKDGSNMTVTVTEAKSREIILKVNGKPDASSKGDLPTQILCAQIPLLLRPEAKKVLVVGLGSGITAGSVLRHPVDRLDVVEISREVIEASRFFDAHNHHALKDPRLKLYLEDAKTFLKVSQQRYDIIISEPSNPWVAGVGNLFTMEFYQDARLRLSPDGIMIQWVHAYEMTDDVLRLLLRTFTASFEYVELWNPMGTDLLLIGSKAPPAVDFEKSLKRFNDPGIKEELKRLGIESFATILSLQMASDEGVRKAAGKGRVNEDLFPILEYEAPKAFFLGRNSRFLLSHDERRRPRKGALLYFTRYHRENLLERRDLRNLGTYHLSHRSLGSPDLARAFVGLWLQRASTDPEAHWALARMEEQKGDLEAARREIQYLLRVDPKNEEYLEAAARVEFQSYLNQRSLLDSHTPEKALVYLHRLSGLEGNKKGGIYRLIAQVHQAEGDYKSALSYLEKAAAYAENNRGDLTPETLWLEAAEVAMEVDDDKIALGFLDKALKHNPENSRAKKMLRQLSYPSQNGMER